MKEEGKAFLDSVFEEVMKDERPLNRLAVLLHDHSYPSVDD